MEFGPASRDVRRPGEHGPPGLAADFRGGGGVRATACLRLTRQYRRPAALGWAIPRQIHRAADGDQRTRRPRCHREKSRGFDIGRSMPETAPKNRISDDLDVVCAEHRRRTLPGSGVA